MYDFQKRQVMAILLAIDTIYGGQPGTAALRPALLSAARAHRVGRGMGSNATPTNTGLTIKPNFYTKVIVSSQSSVYDCTYQDDILPSDPSKHPKNSEKPNKKVADDDASNRDTAWSPT
jgi:hypothetical protein